jgi:hypothetical protein
MAGLFSIFGRWLCHGTRPEFVTPPNGSPVFDLPKVCQDLRLLRSRQRFDNVAGTSFPETRGRVLAGRGAF